MPFARKPDASLTRAALESRIRRGAQKLGLVAMKSRALAGTAYNRGGWQLVEPKSQKIVAGRFYSLSDEAVLERFQ